MNETSKIIGTGFFLTNNYLVPSSITNDEIKKIQNSPGQDPLSSTCLFDFEKFSKDSFGTTNKFSYPMSNTKFNEYKNVNNFRVLYPDKIPDRNTLINFTSNTSIKKGNIQSFKEIIPNPLKDTDKISPSKYEKLQALNAYTNCPYGKEAQKFFKEMKRDEIFTRSMYYHKVISPFQDRTIYGLGPDKTKIFKSSSMEDLGIEINGRFTGINKGINKENIKENSKDNIGIGISTLVQTDLEITKKAPSLREYNIKRIMKIQKEREEADLKKFGLSSKRFFIPLYGNNSGKKIKFNIPKHSSSDGELGGGIIAKYLEPKGDIKIKSTPEYIRDVRLTRAINSIRNDPNLVRDLKMTLHNVI